MEERGPSNETKTTGAPRMPRRGLLKRLGKGAFTLLAAPAGVGILDPLPASAAEPDRDAIYDAVGRSDRDYVAACERAFREDLATVDADYEARLREFTGDERDRGAHQAACEREREELRERVHAGREAWLETRAGRRKEMLRSCGVGG